MAVSVVFGPITAIFTPTFARFITMRAIFEQQLELGPMPIEKIRLDPKSRDDIPAVLRGLQHIHMTRDIRMQLVAILEKRVSPNVNRRHGRPGMSL